MGSGFPPWTHPATPPPGTDSGGVVTDSKAALRDQLAEMRIDLVELKRASEWLHRLYWCDHQLSWASYRKQDKENTTLLVDLIGRIRALEREVTGETGDTEPSAPTA